MKIGLVFLIGYLLGSLNPAALVSLIKHRNLRQSGTGNLGATNTMLVFGKGWAALVLAIDLAKGFLAYKIAAWVLPACAPVAVLAGFCAVLGHCYPFYMGFKGGKGLATFGGLVLAYHPILFLFLLVTGFALMFLVNYSYALIFYATTFFALFVGIRERSLAMLLSALAVSLFVFVKNFYVFLRARRGEDVKIRDYVRTKFFRKSDS